MVLNFVISFKINFSITIFIILGIERVKIMHTMENLTETQVILLKLFGKIQKNWELDLLQQMITNFMQYFTIIQLGIIKTNFQIMCFLRYNKIMKIYQNNSNHIHHQI
jgi:hypothetical protein